MSTIPPKQLGSDTEAVLRRIGYSDEEIEKYSNK
jgi:crotonobetainyl-CoA:carnitine CoA-transferase CaiB-like acyl-CoA transferase